MDILYGQPNTFLVNRIVEIIVAFPGMTSHSIVTHQVSSCVGRMTSHCSCGPSGRFAWADVTLRSNCVSSEADQQSKIFDASPASVK